MSAARCYSCGCHDGSHVKPAYRWTTRIGNEVLLCAPCCALWRQFAQEDSGTTLLPTRIEQLSALP